MTEEGLNHRFPITEWFDIERRMAIVARMTADRPHFETRKLTNSPRNESEDKGKL
ncbi:MAG: hypothetical protein PVI03_03840 [Candidatus Thorarchaeota archaeon]|jgi:hypothetical protein